MTETAADDMLRDPGQQQRRGVHVPKPMRREVRRHPALEDVPMAVSPLTGTRSDNLNGGER